MNCPTCAAPLPDGANYCPKCGRLVSQAVTSERKGIPVWIIAVLVAGALIVFGLPFILIFAAILIPNFLQAHDQSLMFADKSNLKQIATAVEEYAADHNGRYPERLEQLLPQYLSKVPSVPGGEGNGVYSYHHPASRPGRAAYDIWDDGSMNPRFFAPITQSSGVACDDVCKYVVYVADKGFIGVPGVGAP